MRYALLVFLAVAALGDANCVGNRPTCSVDGAGDSVATADSVSASDATADSVATADQSVEIVHPDDITVKNTPSIGLGTPQGSAGVGVAFPGGGLSLNLPLDRAFMRLQGFVEMDMAEAGIRDYCHSKRRARPFGGTTECAETLSRGLAKTEGAKEHERLEERIKELEAEISRQRRAEQTTKQKVDKSEQRRRDALKQLEAIRG